jgi:hypothetical protein
MDGFLDVHFIGNDFGIEVQQGKADALHGITLLNQRGTSFSTLPFTSTGFYVPGDGKSLVALKVKGQTLLLAGQNNDKLLAFTYKKQEKLLIPFQKNDKYAIIHFKNGTKRKMEAYFGHSFFSQSANFIPMTSLIAGIDFFGSNGKWLRYRKNN